jgi:hypothetical protein
VRRLRAALAAVAVLAAMTAGATAGAAAAPARIVGLHVEGGEGWHWQEQFLLGWDFDTDGTAAIHYRVRAADGTVVAEERLPGAIRTVDDVRLDHDGVYLAEVWAEDAFGSAGLPAAARLRLDRVRPGATTPLLPQGWIAGSQAVHIGLTHPGGAPPPSGIRGYAVSIDTDPNSSPCAAEFCAEGEIDLRGGAGDDTLVVPSLPEGRLYVHAVAVSGAGLRSGQVGTAIALVDATPPRVGFEGVPGGWVRGPVAVRAVASDARAGMAAGDAAGAFTAIAVDGGPPTVSRGATSATVVSGDGVHRLTASARDAVGNGGGEPSATATVRIDTEPPRVAFADRPDPDDRDRIEATVSDGGSGAAAQGWIGFRPAGSRQRFEPLPTAAAAGRLTARWDPTAHRPGTYELQAVGSDLAGNSAAGNRRANGSRMLIVNPERAETRIEARIVEDAMEPGGSGRSLRGRLRSANRLPLPGREVEVTETYARGAVLPPRTTTVRTGPDGDFTLRLAPGPSRRLQLAFAGDRSFAPAPPAAVPLEVPTRVRFTASSRRARVGGRPVVFRGRVATPGAALPRGGLAVTLEFRLRGTKWSEFRTVASDSHGGFRYPYAFADDDSRGVRFQFRAVVAEQEGWPYAAGASRAIAVTGR